MIDKISPNPSLLKRGKEKKLFQCVPTEMSEETIMETSERIPCLYENS
jgi:hypothetical protein